MDQRQKQRVSGKCHLTKRAAMSVEPPSMPHRKPEPVTTPIGRYQAGQAPTAAFPLAEIEKSVLVIQTENTCPGFPSLTSSP